MIDLWPAIDLINSTSVRLTEGKYDTKEKNGKICRRQYPIL